MRRIMLFYLIFFAFSLSAVIPEMEQITHSIEIGVKRGLESFHAQNENNAFLKNMAILGIGTGILYCFWSKFRLANGFYIKKRLSNASEKNIEQITKHRAQSNKELEDTKKLIDHTKGVITKSDKSFVKISEGSLSQANEKSTSVNNLNEFLKKYWQKSNSYTENLDKLKIITDNLIEIEDSTNFAVKKYLEKMSIHHNKIDQLQNAAVLMAVEVERSSKTLMTIGVNMKRSQGDAKQINKILKQAVENLANEKPSGMSNKKITWLQQQKIN